MDTTRDEHWLHDFEDIPLTPPGKTAKGFPHVPLEHELIASRSAWDDDDATEEGRECRYGTLREGAGSASSEESGAASPSEEWMRRSFKARGDISWVIPGVCPDRGRGTGSSTPGNGNENGGLVETAKATAHLPSSTQSQPISPPPSSRQTPTLPIPIFPFPAGTTHCTQRACPIPHPHERGPYLHDGKLRSRRHGGSVFGASNPPPEIWALYDARRLRDGMGGGTGRGSGMEVGADDAVERFVRFHYGETETERVVGGVKDGGAKGRGKGKGKGKGKGFWRWWW